MSRCHSYFGLVAAACAALLAMNLDHVRAEKRTSAVKSKAEVEKPETVEMFAAMKSGDIEVQLIFKDAKSGNVIITNKTKKPLSVKLPEAFAGVHAQFGGGGLGGGGMGGMGGGGMGGMGGGGMGGGQGMGGGMGGMGGGMGGMGGGGMGGGGGFFNVAPDRPGKIKVAAVCLEHGKKDPNPRMRYEIRPIESFTDKPEIVELCKMVGRGEIPQNAAQAAAWHMANGLSWQELLHKDRVRHLNGTSEKYFTFSEIQLAARIQMETLRRGKENPILTPGKSDSLSRSQSSE